MQHRDMKRNGKRQMAKERSYKPPGKAFIREGTWLWHHKVCMSPTDTLWQCIAIWQGEMSDVQDGIPVLGLWGFEAA